MLALAIYREKNDSTLITEHVEMSKTSQSRFQSFASTLPVLTINNSSNVTINYHVNFKGDPMEL